PFAGAGRALVEMAEGTFDVEADGGQALRKGVMDLAGDTGALLGAGEAEALFGEAGAFDGDAELVGDGGEKGELVVAELPVGGPGDVHDAEGAALEADGDSGVEAE